MNLKHLSMAQWAEAPLDLQAALATLCAEGQHCRPGADAEGLLADPSRMNITAGVLVDWLLADGAGLIVVKPRHALVGEGEFLASGDWQCAASEPEETAIDCLWPLVVLRWKQRAGRTT